MFTVETFYKLYYCKSCYSYLINCRWIDDKNHTKLTRPWYCKTLPFPLNFYYPSKYQKNAEQTIEGMFDMYIDSPEIETRVISTLS